MLSKIAGPFQIKQYFDWGAHALAFGDDLQEDLSFVHALRQALLPIPYLDRDPVYDTDLFPPFRPFVVEALAGKKIGLVASGGSGVLIATLGVMRVLEEAGLEVAAISACSGSALFLAPIAAGLSAQQAMEFALSWRTEQYIDPDWRGLLKASISLGRGFTGVIKAEALERLYHQRLGGVMVGDLPIPFYANIWEIDHNRLLYLGSETTPAMRLARLVRASVALPVFMQPVEIDGALCGDGGIINVFPTQPLVEHHPEIDFFIGINGFYPENFDGEDHSGWQDKTWSVLRVSPQSRHSQHLEVARMQMRLIQDRCLLLHPVPYQEIKGVKFYEQFIDRSRWPEFIMRGYNHTRRTLALLDQART
ncbi:MAG TPA: patatin-like phospholipase family protein [Anaerolineae bacterium]|nr:patatin-like phospholipase family protein [Anaerolineae bacterium]HNU03353.1 patatin-like phospholipase family protein [Anaerolineae bacterium]